MNDLTKRDSPHSLDNVIQSLAEHFSTHPGFMWTTGGFEVLHADWPAYPPGHGIRITLRVLTAFPPGPPLYRVDDIDQCSLFVVGRRPDKNPFDSRYIHIALWDDDLASCAKQGFVEGVYDDGEFLQVKGEYAALTPEGAHAA